MSALPSRFDYPLTSPVPTSMPANPLKLVLFDGVRAKGPQTKGSGLPRPGAEFARLEPTAELLDGLQAASSRLESASPEEIIAWGVEHYAPYLTMATAFGP